MANKQKSFLNNLNDLLLTNTDIAEFNRLYKRFGIDLIINVEDDETYIIILGEDGCYVEGATFSDKFGGYNCFFSSIRFNKDGDFIRQEFWE